MHPTPAAERNDWVREREAWRLSLDPGPVPHFLTGLKLRPPDPRDYLLSDDPKVADKLAVGYPEAADLLRFVSGSTYNQGAVPSCVCHTAALCQSGHQQIEESRWRLYDAQRCHRETGPVSEGRWPDAICRYWRDTGLVLANSEERHKIEAYAFVPVGAQWEATIKAAIASEKFMLMAMLLPAIFGWDSSGPPTQNYHEILIVGYDRTHFLIKNSWGEGWGRNGLGRIPIEMVAGGQNGYLLIHAPTDQRLGPTPPPPPTDLSVTSLAIVPAAIRGGEAATATVGLSGTASTAQTVKLVSVGPGIVPGIITVPAGQGRAQFGVAGMDNSQGTVTVTASLGSSAKTASVQVTRDTPPPPPPVNAIKIGGSLTGTGLDRVQLNSIVNVTAAGVTATLKVESREEDPEPEPGPDPGPTPPPTDLDVVIDARVFGRSLLYLQVSVVDGTQILPATCYATVSGQEVGPFPTAPDVRYVRNVVKGTPVTVRVKTADGREATETVTAQ